MKLLPKMFFVVPQKGSELNSVMRKNFGDDVVFHDQITIINGDKKEHLAAYELTPQEMEALQTYLNTENFNEKLKVAVQIDGGEIRWARPEEYLSGKRHQKKLEKGTATRVSKTAAARAPRMGRKKPLYVSLEQPKPKISVPEHPQLPLGDI